MQERTFRITSDDCNGPVAADGCLSRRSATSSLASSASTCVTVSCSTNATSGHGGKHANLPDCATPFASWCAGPTTPYTPTLNCISNMCLSNANIKSLPAEP